MTLMNTLIDLQTSFYSIAPTGIIDTATDLTQRIQSFFQLALGVAILVVLGVGLIQRKFAVAAIVAGMLGAGLAVWLVNFNGIEWLGQQVEDELSASAVTVVSASLV